MSQDPPPPVYWMNGALIPKQEAVVPITDLAVARGYGAFDALRTYGRVPLFLREHVERFEQTCGYLFLTMPLSREALAKAILETIAANPYEECLVRFWVTGGGAAEFVPKGGESLIIAVDPLVLPPASYYDNGIALRSTSSARTLPVAKSTNYMVGVLETRQARAEGYNELVFRDSNGGLLEGTTFSVVGVKGNTLTSASESVLPGLTVKLLFAHAGGAGYEIIRKPIPLESLAGLDECFITSSSRELVPVIRIDDITIGSGAPGPKTRQLHELYKKAALAACSAV